jgi:hypothetical protein
MIRTAGSWKARAASGSYPAAFAAVDAAKAALDVLTRCKDDDVRSAELEEVLLWVERRSIRKNPVHRFREALAVADSCERKAAMTDAYVRVMRELGLYSGRL